MEVRRVEPSFGHIVLNPATPAVRTYLDCLPRNKANKIEQIAKSEIETKIPVYLSMLMNYCKPKFSAEVGNKRFTENFFQGPVTITKRAAKYARKLAEEQKLMSESGADKINRPKLQDI